MTSGRKLIAALAAAAVVALMGTVAGATTESAASAAGKPKWLTIPAFWDGVSGPWVVGSASGRGWLGLPRFDGDSLSTLLGSLHHVRGKASFAKVVLTRSQGPMMIVDSSLVYHLPDVSGTPGELRTAPLLADGSVGNPRAVADDPEKIPPQDFDPVVADGIQVGDRNVWVLTGYKSTQSGGVAARYLWACCPSAGELSPLSRFFDPKRNMGLLQLGRDNKGRLWLAWSDLYFRKAWGAVKMVELDPDTLVPRTSKAFVAPAPDSWLRPKLVCADNCRIVVQDLGGDIFTWAPGERVPTRMGLGTRQTPATLLDASFRSGHLEVASVKPGSKLVKVGAGFANVFEISVVRGDARGSHARRVGSVEVPGSSGDPTRDAYIIAGYGYATLVPGGLVYFMPYNAVRSYTKTRLITGVVTLRSRRAAA